MSVNNSRERDLLPQKRQPVKQQNREKEIVVIREYDHLIFVAVLMLVIFGLVMVFSASYYSEMVNTKDHDMYGLFRSQLICTVIGYIGLIIAATVDFELLSLFSLPLYIFANASLVYVKFFGKVVNGARRWINIGGFFTFQPSELAKAAVIFLLAVYISKNRERVSTLKGLAGCAIIIGLPVALVLWGNNLSTALIICAIGFIMIFMASPYFWRFIILATSGGVGLFLYLTFAEGFRNARLLAWKNPFAFPDTTGYQIIQSLYAIASGGLFGLGLGQSNQKLIYMPEPHNDFIFSIVCEELGFFGALIVLILFSVLIWRGVSAAIKARSLLGTLIATGIVTMIATQVMINVAVVTNSIPNTGIPLPFISHGGTSIIVMLTLIGVLLNITRKPRTTAA